jgi:hypothetical protein
MPTIGISLPQRGFFWGRSHFLGTHLRPPTKRLNSLGSLKLLSTVVFSGGLLDYKMIPTCVDNKHSQKNNEINTSHHIMAAHPKAGMQIWCKGVGSPWCPPWNRDSKLRVASPTIPVRRIEEDQGGSYLRTG